MTTAQKSRGKPAEIPRKVKFFCHRAGIPRKRESLISALILSDTEVIDVRTPHLNFP